MPRQFYWNKLDVAPKRFYISGYPHPLSSSTIPDDALLNSIENANVTLDLAIDKWKPRTKTLLLCTAINLTSLTVTSLMVAFAPDLKTMGIEEMCLCVFGGQFALARSFYSTWKVHGSRKVDDQLRLKQNVRQYNHKCIHL